LWIKSSNSKTCGNAKYNSKEKNKKPTNPSHIPPILSHFPNKIANKQYSVRQPQRSEAKHHSEKNIYTNNPYIELVKDADVFACSLYKNAADEY
jgi:hypothetical protein